MEMKLITNCKYELTYKYYVTDDGRVWSEESQKFLSMQKDKNGYLKVRLRSNDLPPEGRHRYSVHRLVLENFNPVEGMDKLQVNHIDGNKENNCLSNLEWTTCEENIHHAINNNLRAKVNGAAKLTPEQVKEIYIRCHKGETCASLAREFHMSSASISKIKLQQLWKSVTSDIIL